MRQAEGFAGQQLGGANLFKFVEYAGRVRMVVQQQLDHRFNFLVHKLRFGQSLVGLVGVGSQPRFSVLCFLQSVNQQIQVVFEVLSEFHQGV